MDKIVLDLRIMNDFTLNEYIKAERTSRFAASNIKKKATTYCRNITADVMIHGLKFDWPVKLKFDWYLPNRRKDPDNWSFMKKFIFDGMQKAIVQGVPFLDNDNFKNMHHGYDEDFYLDKDWPRLEIYQVVTSDEENTNGKQRTIC